MFLIRFVDFQILRVIHITAFSACVCGRRLRFCREIENFVSLRWRSPLRKMQTAASNVNQPLDGLYNFRLLWQRKFGKLGLEFCQKLTAKILFYKDWKFLSNLVVRPQIVTPNFWYILWYQIIAFGQPIIKQLMDWPHCGLAIKMCCTY